MEEDAETSHRQFLDELAGIMPPPIPRAPPRLYTEVPGARPPPLPRPPLQDFGFIPDESMMVADEYLLSQTQEYEPELSQTQIYEPLLEFKPTILKMEPKDKTDCIIKSKDEKLIIHCHSLILETQSPSLSKFGFQRTI